MHKPGCFPSNHHTSTTIALYKFPKGLHCSHRPAASHTTHCSVNKTLILRPQRCASCQFVTAFSNILKLYDFCHLAILPSCRCFKVYPEQSDPNSTSRSSDISADGKVRKKENVTKKQVKGFWLEQGLCVDKGRAR